MHFVPAYDKWFNEKYVKEWGEKNNTAVTVDNIGVAGLSNRAAAEVSARKGHDLFLFNWPPPFYEEQVIVMQDVYVDARRSMANPSTWPSKVHTTRRPKKYFGFSPSFTPDPINWRKDLWDDVGIVPDSWEKILDGGRKIKQKHKIPVGIGLAQELDTAMAVRTIMYSFGAHEQDVNGYLTLNSKNTVEAVKFVKALFQEAMTPKFLLGTLPPTTGRCWPAPSHWHSTLSPSPGQVKKTTRRSPRRFTSLRRLPAQCAGSAWNT